MNQLTFNESAPAGNANVAADPGQKLNELVALKHIIILALNPIGDYSHTTMIDFYANSFVTDLQPRLNVIKTMIYGQDTAELREELEKIEKEEAVLTALELEGEVDRIIAVPSEEEEKLAAPAIPAPELLESLEKVDYVLVTSDKGPSIRKFSINSSPGLLSTIYKILCVIGQFFSTLFSGTATSKNEAFFVPPEGSRCHVTQASLSYKPK